MRKPLVFVLMLAVSTLLMAHRPKPEPLVYHPDQMIVRGFIPDGAEVIRFLGKGRTLVRTLPGMNVAESIDAALREPGVSYAVPNYNRFTTLVPNDGLYGQQWEHAVMGTEAAWDITTGSPDILISIIDTGVNPIDPDISPKWIPGWDYWQNIPGGFDTQTHGSHVAGSAAAIGNNGINSAGVCWGCSVTSHKFLNCCGSGFTSDAILAIDAAVEAGADVLNNSWTGGGFSQAVVDSISAACDQGVVFVVAAGNSARNIDIAPTYPAAYDLPCIITVGSSDQGDGLSGFSNYGSVAVDLLAPGSNIVSLAGPQGGTECLRPHAFSGRSLSGTSMSTPMVAGTAGLLLSHNPGWTWVEVKAAIMSSVDIIPAAVDTVSKGRLNIERALSGTPPDPDPDPVSFCGDDTCDEGEYCGSGRVRNGALPCSDDCPRVKGRRSRRACCGNGEVQFNEDILCPENP